MFKSNKVLSQIWIIFRQMQLKIDFFKKGVKFLNETNDSPLFDNYPSIGITKYSTNFRLWYCQVSDIVL